MPNLKECVLVGGLTVLGYLAGGKLGSMFGAVIGSVVCSMFNETTTVNIPHHQPFEEIEDSPRYSPYRRESSAGNSTRASTNRKRNVKKPKDKSNEPSKCAICLEIFKPSIVLLPCSHMCFCDECYEKVKKQEMYTCPICRERIEKVMYVYPS